MTNENIKRNGTLKSLEVISHEKQLMNKDIYSKEHKTQEGHDSYLSVYEGPPSIRRGKFVVPDGTRRQNQNQ